MADRYESVRTTLPQTLPPITREEAQRAADRLWKHFVKPTRMSHRRVRRCWISRSPTCGHYRGWGRLVHDVSHRIFAKFYPERRPHDPLHAHYETEVAAYVVRMGWLDGKLKPKKTTKPKETAQERRAKALVSTQASIKRWESKERRAANALKKLKRKLAGLVKEAPRRSDQPRREVSEFPTRETA